MWTVFREDVLFKCHTTIEVSLCFHIFFLIAIVPLGGINLSVGTVITVPVFRVFLLGASSPCNGNHFLVYCTDVLMGGITYQVEK